MVISPLFLIINLIYLPLKRITPEVFFINFIEINFILGIGCQQLRIRAKRKISTFMYSRRPGHGRSRSVGNRSL